MKPPGIVDLSDMLVDSMKRDVESLPWFPLVLGLVILL